MDVYIEMGKKKCFANAVEWPGWGRSGRDQAGALQALLAYAPRYARAIQPAGLDFHPPEDIGGLQVIKDVEGNASTDFGAFGVVPSEDIRPVSAGDLERFQALLCACWQTLEQTAEAAAGKELLKGPRGGGRELDGILRHVIESQAAYMGRIGVKFKVDPNAAMLVELRCGKQTVLDGLSAAARGELPERGPRGGVYWPPRYFVRTLTWHVLDHAWEIEDRVISK